MNDDSSANNDDLDIELFLKKFDDWISSSKEMGVSIKELRITGGEPLLREEGLIRIVQRCQSASITCGINTNASLLSEKLAQQLKEVGLETVKISLDAVNQDILAKIKGKKALNALIVFFIHHPYTYR